MCVFKAYQHGRKWLAYNIRNLADSKDTLRADQLEEQATRLVDHLYRMWEERNFEQLNMQHNATNAKPAASFSGVDWLGPIVSASNLEALRGELTSVISANIETVISVGILLLASLQQQISFFVLQIMQSLWTVVLMNISLLSTMIGAILSLVLGFGFDLLNFFIEIIVFLTAVYYLLASSDSQWLPLKWINDLFSTIKFASRQNHSMAIGEAIENAIRFAIFVFLCFIKKTARFSGVFVLSAKMSIFYGLYTYFVHSLFDLNVVFIPASIFLLQKVFKIVFSPLN